MGQSAIVLYHTRNSYFPSDSPSNRITLFTLHGRVYVCNEEFQLTFISIPKAILHLSLFPLPSPTHLTNPWAPHLTHTPVTIYHPWTCKCYFSPSSSPVQFILSPREQLAKGLALWVINCLQLLLPWKRGEKAEVTQDTQNNYRTNQNRIEYFSWKGPSDYPVQLPVLPRCYTSSGLIQHCS